MASRARQDGHGGSSQRARWGSDDPLVGGWALQGSGGAVVVDVLYVALLIGIFVVLAGVLRGLERL